MTRHHPGLRLAAAVPLAGLVVLGLVPAAPASAGDAPAPAAEATGAALPYTEYEAEDGRHNGTLLQTDPERTFGHTNYATESSG
ncbi:hypothetical protein ACL02R_17620, partial [Streptomyces sp. MS19]